MNPRYLIFLNRNTSHCPLWRMGMYVPKGSGNAPDTTFCMDKMNSTFRRSCDYPGSIQFVKIHDFKLQCSLLGSPLRYVTAQPNDLIRFLSVSVLDAQHLRAGWRTSTQLWRVRVRFRWLRSMDPSRRELQA